MDAAQEIVRTMLLVLGGLLTGSFIRARYGTGPEALLAGFAVLLVLVLLAVLVTQ